MCMEMFVARPLPWKYNHEDMTMARLTEPPCATASNTWSYAVNTSISIVR